jgi:hypothetical protein
MLAAMVNEESDDAPGRIAWETSISEDAKGHRSIKLA